MTRQWNVLAICAGLVPSLLVAQVGGRGQRRMQQNVDAPPPAQRIAQIMKVQLNLSDTQARSLQQTNQRFNQRLGALNNEERQARMTMRDGVCSGDTSHSADVARSLDQLVDLQKRRAQMLDDEQRELSGFLTPFQRARYLGFEEMVLDAGRGGRGGRAGRQGQGPPPGGPPGAGPPNPDGPPNGPPNGPPPLMGRGGRAGIDMCAPPPIPRDSATRGGKKGGKIK